MKTLNSILPNAGVAAAYRRELNALIDDLFEAYRANLLSEIVGMAASGEVKAADAKPKTPKEAEEVFKAKAAEIAAKFAKKAGRHVEAGLIQAMKKAGFSQADLRRLRQDKTAYAAIEQQIINNNVALITKIPADVELKIRKMVERSIEKDRDLGGLVKELDTLQEMTHRRSRFISIDQNNKITNQMSLLKVQSLGITEGIWMHRGGAKVPRPTHLAMHGQRFNLAEGLFDEDEGRFVLCGELYNCHCTYKPILPDIMQSGELEQETPLDKTAEQPENIASQPNKGTMSLVKPSIKSAKPKEPRIPQVVRNIKPTPEHEKVVHDNREFFNKTNPLKKKDLKEIKKTLKTLLSSDDVRMVTMVPDAVIPNILKDGRLKSQFETGNSGGVVGEERALAERDMMSLPLNTAPNERPIYGLIAREDEERGSIYQQARFYAGSYGNVAIVYKNDVKRYATFTGGDSLANKRDIIPSPLLDPNTDSINILVLSEIKRHMDNGNLPYAESNILGGGFTVYTEVQIHGTQATLENIDEIVYSKNTKEEDIPVKALKEAGVKWRIEK